MQIPWVYQISTLSLVCAHVLLLGRCAVPHALYLQSEPPLSNRIQQCEHTQCGANALCAAPAWDAQLPVSAGSEISKPKPFLPS